MKFYYTLRRPNKHNISLGIFYCMHIYNFTSRTQNNDTKFIFLEKSNLFYYSGVIWCVYRYVGTPKQNAIPLFIIIFKKPFSQCTLRIYHLSV